MQFFKRYPKRGIVLVRTSTHPIQAYKGLTFVTATFNRVIGSNTPRYIVLNTNKRGIAQALSKCKRFAKKQGIACTVTNCK